MKTVNMYYSSRKGKEYSKGETEVIRAASPTIGPKLKGCEWGWQVCVLGGKMLPLKFQRAGPSYRGTIYTGLLQREVWAFL